MRAEGRWESRTVLAWLLSEAVSLTQHSQILKCIKHLSALYLLQKLDALCIPFDSVLYLLLPGMDLSQ